MKAERNRIGVIGSGLAGLASACVLAARGYAVTVFERSPWLGGKAAVLEEGGFRFDMGPTILTIPSVLRRIFVEAGRKLEEYLDLIRLDPQWRCFFTDGHALDLVEDVDEMAQSLDKFAPGTNSANGYCKFHAVSERLHQISNRHYFWKPIGGVRDMIDWRAGFSLQLMGDIMNLRMGRSVAGTVRKFVPDARVAQMLDHFTQYVGSCPESSPAVLCGIAHMQTTEGVWYPRGGTRAVPNALVRLGGELGVEYRTSCGVKRVLTDYGKRVRGVETDTGEVIELAAVVSNADSARTHRELLAETAPKAANRFERRRGYEPACSGVVLYLGLNKAYDHLLHHDFVFSADPHEEFEFIYRKGEPAPDPTCYLASTSRTEPDTAPPGGDALYVLVHTPYLRPHHDWKRMLPAYRHVIIEKLKTTGQMPDIESRIVYESALTPQDIHDRYHVLNGAIYGLASHGTWNGAFKPSNRSPDVKGLYLAGGAAHPGPGMPMVLMSGWIAADALDHDKIAPKGVVMQTAHPATIVQPHHELVRNPCEANAKPSFLPHRWPWLIRGFRRYACRYVRKHMHAVRLSKSGCAFPISDEPLLVVLNHPSWWDPMIGIVLSRELPGRDHFAAIDAVAVEQYRFFRKLGFVGVDTKSLHGAKEFLRAGSEILSQPNRVFWVTAQGRFTDVRERPLALQAGVGHLAARLKRGIVLPIALEYTFWTERTPEALVRIGEPLSIAELLRLKWQAVDRRSSKPRSRATSTR